MIDMFFLRNLFIFLKNFLMDGKLYTSRSLSCYPYFASFNGQNSFYVERSFVTPA